MKKVSFSLFLLMQSALIFQSYTQETIEVEIPPSDEYIIVEIQRSIKYKQLNSASIFAKTRYDSIADFHKTKFNINADFSKVVYDSLANFQSAWFVEKAIFIKAEFHSGTNFSDVQFDSYVNFKEAQFFSSANFKEAKFDTTVNFFQVKFDSIADFQAAYFGSEIVFTAFVVPNYLGLSYITNIPIEIDLTTAIANPKYDACYINLTASAIDKIKFRYKRFKLWFPEVDSIGYELKANVYEKLLEKQKKEGFTQSYEILDKEYRGFQYLDPGSDYSWLWGHTLNWIDKNWWGYGYDKELILRNVILIYLLLSLINAFMLKHLTTRVYTNQKIEELWVSRQGRNWINTAFNSFWFSLFYTALIFFGLKFDMEKLKYKENLVGWKKLNLAYFFIIYLGGFVCLAYLANYIITV